MATAYTIATATVEPDVFANYFRTATTEKSALIQSGAMVLNPGLNGMLQGGGRTFDRPFWNDLPNDAAIGADDSASSLLEPQGIGTSKEIVARLVRAQGWGASDLSAILSGDDPMAALTARVGAYWARELQRTFVAAWKGVILDNTANDSADYTNDISDTGSPTAATRFSAEAVIDTVLTAGDTMEDFAMIMMHSIVYARAKKNDLIDFRPDSLGGQPIPFFHNLRVVVDDGMPNASGDYDTWIFGNGATEYGDVAHPHPAATVRNELEYKGSGQEALITRVVWAVHPVGHQYTGTAPLGGPTNAATTHNLAIATSWDRVFAEREQVRFARLLTSE